MEQDQKPEAIQVQDKHVVGVLKQQLGQKIEQNVMLQALAVQQQEEIAHLRSMLEDVARQNGGERHVQVRDPLLIRKEAESAAS